MPAIRGWNGSAWVPPKYCTKSTYATKTFESFQAPQLYWDWQFNGDTGGWYKGGSPYPPVDLWGNVHMYLPSNGTFYTHDVFSQWLYTSDIDSSSSLTGVKAQCMIKCDLHSMVGVGGYSVWLQIGYGGLWWAGDYRYYNTSFDWVTYTTPTLSTLSLRPFNITIWGGTSTEHGLPESMNYTIYVDWVRVLDQNGNQIRNTGMVPKYWNGSSWIDQTGN